MENETKKIKKPRSKKNYINNRELYEVLCKWQDDMNNSEDRKVKMPEYLGEAFLKIAENLGHKTPRNTLLEDMIGHAVCTCCASAELFDRERSQNPFAFFTTCINNAFAQIYNKEKDLINAKFDMLKELNNGEEYDYREHDDE